MTAKEKAIGLYSNYKGILNIQNDMRPGANPFAVHCAEYFVDETIKELTILQINEFHDAWVVSRVNFWNEVKQELKKL